MKTTQKLVIWSALVAAVSFVAFATDKPTPKERVLRIESNGQTVAEVRLLAPGRLQFGGVRTASPSGQTTVRANGQSDMATIIVTFEDGSVVRLQSSADISGSQEVLDTTK